MFKILTECPKYEINTLGEIRNIETKKILKAHLGKDGYFRIRLVVDKKRLNCLLHRLLAIAFLPNSHEKTQVNHKDGNKQNNDIENLEWNTPSENTQHAYEMGLAKGRLGVEHHSCKLSEKDIVKIRILCNNGITHKIIAKKFNVHVTLISKIKVRKIWKHI